MRDEQQSAPIALSKSKIFLFTASVIILTLAAAVIFLEIYLGKKGAPEFPFWNEIYPYVMFRPESNSNFTSHEPSKSSRTGEHVRLFTNKDSLRIPSPDYRLAKAKPANQLRIAVIGGSTVQDGTTYEVTLPGAIKRVLQSIYPKRNIEVINAGIISALARQELIHLLLVVVDYEPDILITYDGINDTGTMLNFEDKPNFPYNWEVMKIAWDQFMSEIKEPWWKLLLSRSAIVQRLWPGFALQSSLRKKIEPEIVIKCPNVRKRYVRVYLENWEKILHVCRGYNIYPAFILQPTSLYGDENYKKYREDFRPAEKISYAHKMVYDDARVAVAEFAKQHPDAAVRDISDLLPKTSFYDGCHVYDEVNDTIAAQIVKLIDPVIEKMNNSKSTSDTSR